MKRLCMFLVAAFTAFYLINAAAVHQDISKPDANPAASVAAHFDADAATRAWLDTMSPQARARSDAYFEGGYWLILWDFVVTLLVAWLLLGTGLSRRLRDFNERLVSYRWLQTAFYAVEYIVFTTVVTLPWTLYESYFREHQYGMSNQDMSAFLGDQLKGLIVSLILGTVVLVAIYAVVRWTPRTWWI